MKINKDLIEKYHRQECSPEETEAVEQWLYSSDSDEALQLPAIEDKQMHKQEIWAGIEEFISSQEPAAAEAPKPAAKRKFHTTFWYGAAAASLFLGMLIFIGNRFRKNEQDENIQLLNVSNTSSVDVKQLQASMYDLSIGTNTSGSIDNLTGTVDLAGSLLIRPKENIELQFEGRNDKTSLEKGQTYIILKGKNGHNKVIVINEHNLMDLPPVMQKQIINEFKI
ncbi:hypothetical protein ACSBL2_25035 [Pedobacter sp. AW31-3R]|uniref:hypothetical protein n=1 Tax=Pedobacter sp. AW31-3R TaxID=3445781 RepID=UPI003FA127A7